MRVLLADLYDEGGQDFHYFTAVFECFAKTADDGNVVMVTQVHADGRFVADHCWFHRSKALKKLTPQRGDTLEFLAVVGKYAKPRDFVSVRQIRWDYGLEKVREIRILMKGSEYANSRRVSDTPNKR